MCKMYSSCCCETTLTITKGRHRVSVKGLGHLRKVCYTDDAVDMSQHDAGCDDDDDDDDDGDFNDDDATCC